jgi:hypothetical protein
MERQACRESSLSSCREGGGITTVERGDSGGGGGGRETDQRHAQPNSNVNINNNDIGGVHVDDGNDDAYENSICFSLSNACADLFRNHHRPTIDKDEDV